MSEQQSLVTKVVDIESGKAMNGAGSPAHRFFLQSDFSRVAEILRKQFDTKLSDSIEVNDGLTPFLYAFRPEAYQFLTASADRMFSEHAVGQFLAELRAWANQTLRVSCASTPQLRVYVHGSFRDFLCDSTKSKWHWMLSLGRNHKRRSGQVRLLTERISSNGASMSIERVETLELEFNQLLVHDVRKPYGVGLRSDSVDPSEGLVFLDGYFW